MLRHAPRPDAARKKGVFTVKKILFGFLGLCLLLGLCGCTGTRYRVDYCGQKYAYTGAKDSYRPGEQVVLYYEFIATDTDYSFLLDGQGLRFSYDDSKGFRIEFTMPEHDVRLECRSVNSMEYIPPEDEDPVPDDEALRIEYIRRVEEPADTSLSCILVYAFEEDLAFLRVEDPGTVPLNYLVPAEIIAECQALAREAGMDAWQQTGGGSPSGAAGSGTFQSVCFLGDGLECSADSSRMPEGGREALDRLEELLRSYADEDSLIE